jgi:hypothetical protein
MASSAEPKMFGIFHFPANADAAEVRMSIIPESLTFCMLPRTAACVWAIDPAPTNAIRRMYYAFNLFNISRKTGKLHFSSSHLR